MCSSLTDFVFICNDTPTTYIYTDCHSLSLHDALPIYHHRRDPIVISRTVHPDPQRGVPTFAAGLGVWNGWREHRHSAATAAKRAGVLRPVAATVTASRCRSRISFSPICNTGMQPRSEERRVGKECAST